MMADAPITVNTPATDVFVETTDIKDALPAAKTTLQALAVTRLGTECGDKIQVVNRTGAEIEVFVSNYSQGSQEWFKIADGACETWTRKVGRWESVVASQNGARAGIYVKAGSQVTVHAVDRHKVQDEALQVIERDHDPKSIALENRTPHAIQVYVTPYSNQPHASDDWVTVAPGAIERWTRTGWDMVVVKYNDGASRTGAYVRAGDKVVFNGPAPLKFARTEKASKIGVTNGTSAPIEVRVTTFSGGSNNWFEIAPGESETWTRGSGVYEAVVVRNKQGQSVGAYVPVGPAILVRHLDRQMVVKDMPVFPKTTADQSILVHSATTDVDVLVTSGEQGDGFWSTISAGEKKSYTRQCRLAVVVVRSIADRTKQFGVAALPGSKVVILAAPSETQSRIWD